MAGIPLWFKLFAAALSGLLLAKLLGMQIVIEINYGGRPYLAALTDAGLYFVPLMLVLPYILWCWIRDGFFRSR